MIDSVSEMILAITAPGRVSVVKAPVDEGCHEDLPRLAFHTARLARLTRDWRRALLGLPSEIDADEIDADEIDADEAVPSSLDADRAGRTLFDLLFPGSLRETFRRNADVAGSSARRLRIRLRHDFPPSLDHLRSVPWELIVDPALGDALCRDRDITFVRGPVRRRPRGSVVPEPPLRVLVVAPNPSDARRLSLEDDRRNVLEGLGAAGARILHEMVEAPVTLEALQASLLAFDPQVVHYCGHGRIEADGSGSLLFETRSRKSNAVRGVGLADVLKDGRSLRALVVAACHGASIGERLEAASASTAVAEAATSASPIDVLAMQSEVRDRAIVAFTETFYARLGAGDPLDFAANTARNRLYARSPDNPEWASPVVYLTSDDGLVVRPSSRVEASAAAPAIRGFLRDASAIIERKTQSFVGRGFAFQWIEDLLETDGGCLLITGEPGIGKTTLLAEQLRRHHSPHHFIVRSSAVDSDPRRVMANLAAQVVVEYGLPYESLPPEVETDGQRLMSLLEEALATPGAPDKILLLVDALDELKPSLDSRSNPLDLPRTLPRNVRLLLTRRTKDGQTLFVDTLREEEIRRGSSENLRDAEDYVRRQIVRPGIQAYLRHHGVEERALIKLLRDRSLGNFMYLHHVLHELEEGIYRHEDPKVLPRGLELYYEDHWQRLKEAVGAEDWRELALPVLALVATVEQPISVYLIADELGREDHQAVGDTLRLWRQFLHVEPIESDPRVPGYRLYHGSFHDFVRAKDQVGEQEAMRRRFNDSVIRSIQEDEEGDGGDGDD